MPRFVADDACKVIPRLLRRSSAKVGRLEHGEGLADATAADNVDEHRFGEPSELGHRSDRFGELSGARSLIAEAAGERERALGVLGLIGERTRRRRDQPRRRTEGAELRRRPREGSDARVLRESDGTHAR